MALIKITHTITRTYLPNPGDYPDGYDIEDMAALDRESYEQDPSFIGMDLDHPDAEVTTTTEVIE